MRIVTRGCPSTETPSLPSAFVPCDVSAQVECHAVRADLQPVAGAVREVVEERRVACDDLAAVEGAAGVCGWATAAAGRRELGPARWR